VLGDRVRVVHPVLNNETPCKFRSGVPVSGTFYIGEGPQAGCPRVLQFASQPIEQNGSGFFPDGPWLVVIRNVPVNLGGVHNAVLAIVDELQDLSRLPAGLVLRTRP
jgi:hypothetical protein